MHCQHIGVERATPPVDAHLSGLDPNRINKRETCDEIRAAVHEFGAVLVRKQPLEPAARPLPH